MVGVDGPVGALRAAMSASLIGEGHSWATVPAVRLWAGDGRAVTLYFASTGVVTIELTRNGRTVAITDGSIDWIVDRFFPTFPRA